ncbi:MAG: LamG domain-containing protein [Pseudomonadota bacterium]
MNYLCSQKRANKHSLRLLIIGGLLALLQACGSGSGASTTENPVTAAPDVSNYTGPAPATADVQAFKLNLWDNLVPNNRCGTCHSDDQNPRFVRADDINLAYADANNIVDLTDPGNSIIVNKVRGGHNCWLSSDDACGDIIESYISNWAGESLGASGKEIQLEAPPIQDPGSSKNFPADSGLFSTTVYPLLTAYCAGCHTEAAAVPQSPFFAGDDPDAAYAAAQTRIDLETPANSRFVNRLGSEFHNCWTDNCQADAAAMTAAITDMANAISPTEVDPQLVVSKALFLTDGIISSAGGRHETNVIALYEFKTGVGNTVFDTSGIEPSLNLTLSGDYSWVGGWGVQFTAGKAQGSTTASAKLTDLITATGEYSIEFWAAPGNVTQDGPARIVTYSGGSTSRNFMVGQTLYNYDTFVRSDQTDQGGEPQLSTADDDEDLQATLQHVVVTYDPANGRQIYVNGQHTDDVDMVDGGLLNDWDDTFALALASEVDNQNRWAGTIRLLAIHNRALTPEQIFQNFEVGVGEKYYMLFNVSDHIAIDDAYVVFEVSQFDSYSYLFDEPFFTILDSEVSPGSIPMAGLRIGLNGREVAISQAFANLDTTITDADYATEGLQPLSSLGTIIPLEKGPTLDEFFLTFERLGNETNVVVEADPPPPAVPGDVPRSPELGIRDFAEINATMSNLTGIPRTNPEVAATYDTVHQAMPVGTNIEGFISSQQMAITQLAIKYCSELVDDTTARNEFFPSFPFGTDVGTAFADRSLLLDPLINAMVGNGISTQPDLVDLRAEVNGLVDSLVACGGSCESDRTERIVKASCASVLGSAAMLVQ